MKILWLARSVAALLLFSATMPASAVCAETPCRPGPQVYATVVSNCAYGQPQIDGDLVLVPKICRHDLAGRSVVRRSVEVKLLANGQRVQQASLPPEDSTATTLPAVGQLWPGAPALLAYPGGIAAIEPRAGKADVVLEPQGTLIAMARSADLLALLEQLPSDGKGKPVLEWTVLDLAAGEILGQAHLSLPKVLDLRWVSSASGLQVALEGQADDKRLRLQAPVRDAAGKSLIVKEALVPVPQAAANCVPAAGADPGAMLDREIVRIESAGDAKLGRPGATPDCDTPSKCLAMVGPYAGGRWLVWLQPASGPRELRVCAEPAVK